MGSLIDRFGRRSQYLRLSVIEACNYHCSYCLPKGYQAVPGWPKNLDIDEIARLLGEFATLGVQKIRLTGGEPSLRHDLTAIIRVAADTIGVEKVALTTNGCLLQKRIRDWCDAGLTALNVTVDSLDRDCFKEGGKSGLWCYPEAMTVAERELFRPRNHHCLKNIRAAVLTLSDRAHSGEYADLSGPLLVERLSGLGAEISHTEILPDGIEPLASRLQDLSMQSIQLVLCTGGTGLGPRDLTPEALETLGARHIPGLGEMFRTESRHYTSLAWLSRAEAVLLNGMLVIALPGSPKAVVQGMDILGPILAHEVTIVAGEEHA